MKVRQTMSTVKEEKRGKFRTRGSEERRKKQKELKNILGREREREWVKKRKKTGDKWMMKTEVREQKVASAKEKREKIKNSRFVYGRRERKGSERKNNHINCGRGRG